MDTARLYRALIETIREFQIQNRFAVRAQGTALDLLGSRLLTDIDSYPDILASELSVRLSLSPTVISRAIARLERAGFIKTLVAASDARARKLELTLSGARELTSFDRQSDTRLAEFQSNISKKDFSILQRLLFRFAAGSGIPVVQRTRPEHPLRPAIRTVTQFLGLLHGGIFGTKKLGSAEWQVLSLIDRAPCPIAARDLASQMVAPKNTVSQLIGRLEQAKLLRRVQAEHDKRVVCLMLTQKGRNALEEVRRAGAILLKQALADFMPAELRDMVRLLNLFVGGSHAVIVDCSRYTIVRAVTPDTLAALRSFSVEQAALQQRVASIQPSFYADMTKAYALYDHSTLVACLEFQTGSDSDIASVAHWFHAASYDAPALEADFLNKTAKLMFAASDCKRIELTKAQSPGQVRLPGRYVPALSAHVIQPEDLDS